MAGPEDDPVNIGDYSDVGGAPFEGDLTSQESKSTNGVVETTLIYRVGDATQVATSANVLAYIKSQFGHFYGAINGVSQCTSVTAKQLEFPKGVAWDVTVTYSTARTGPYQYWSIAISHITQNKVLDTAYSGWQFEVGPDADPEVPNEPGDSAAEVTITNSAGEAFDPPLEQEQQRIQIKLGILALPDSNIASADWSDSHDTMNEADINVAGIAIPKWCGLLSVEQTRQPFIDGDGNLIFLIKIDATITIRDETWRRSALDIGMNYLNADATLIPFTPAGRSEGSSSRPQKLDGKGGALDSDSQQDSAWYNGFFTYDQSAWEDLYLPADLTDDTTGADTSGSGDPSSTPDSAGGSSAPSSTPPVVSPMDAGPMPS